MKELLRREIEEARSDLQFWKRYKLAGIGLAAGATAWIGLDRDEGMLQSVLRSFFSEKAFLFWLVCLAILLNSTWRIGGVAALEDFLRKLEHPDEY